MAAHTSYFLKLASSEQRRGPRSSRTYTLRATSHRHRPFRPRSRGQGVPGNAAKNRYSIRGHLLRCTPRLRCEFGQLQGLSRPGLPMAIGARRRALSPTTATLRPVSRLCWCVSNGAKDGLGGFRPIHQGFRHKHHSPSCHASARKCRARLCALRDAPPTRRC